MMTKHSLVCVAAAFLLCGACFAQVPGGGGAESDKPAHKSHVLKGGPLKDKAPASGDEKDGDKPDEKAAQVSAKDTSSTFKIEGDTVHLKSGKKTTRCKSAARDPRLG